MTNALPARKDSRVRETVLSPVAPQGFPGQTNLINFGSNGFPDPLRAAPGLELLKSAAFFIDAANAKTGDAYAFNQGTGRFALDARYGSSLAIGAADTNDPLLLPRTGETYVYLPGSASNTIACTAPVGTASFAAYPTGGGAATTGAAVAGAFTLQTTGSWTRVDILDAGPTVIASFVAANSTSTGYTDAFAVAWTVNRSTAGRKSVAVTRPVWLFATDDYMEVADNELLDFGPSQDFTVMVVARTWNAVADYTKFIIKQAQVLSTLPSPGNQGYDLRIGSSYPSGSGAIGDGTFSGNYNDFPPYPVGITSGSAQVIGMYRNGMSTVAFLNNSTGSPRINSYDLRNSSNFFIGAGAMDMELLAVAVFRRALTATEIATINTYYGTA